MARRALLLLALAAAAAAAAAGPAGPDGAAAKASSSVRVWADPVRVDYYMEALCPYCANFTLSSLAPLFKNKLINYVELTVVPFGNARTDAATGEVTCQHGPVECQLNTLLTCAMALAPIVDDYFPFLTCVEEAALDGVDADGVPALAHKCAVHAGIVTERLMACANSGLGTLLQRLAAQRTASLKPAHQYVPWVVVNGIPIEMDDENIAKYICVAYRGRDRPKACLDIAAPQPAQQPAEAQEEPRERYERCRPDAAAEAAGAGALPVAQ